MDVDSLYSYSDDDNNYNDDDYDMPECRDDSIDRLFKPQNCQILKRQAVLQRMQDDIDTVSANFSLSKDQASILLRNYNWSISRISDVWFDEESEIREKFGFLDKPVIAYNDSNSVECKICFDQFPVNEISSCSCGHCYCNECWSGYLTTSIYNNGLGCVLLTCPDPSCRVPVDQKIIDLLPSDDRKKYSEFLFRSYVESNNKIIKWCPGVNCENIIQFIPDERVIDGGVFDVICECFSSFCWNCDEEGHRPVDCATVKKWILKNTSDSEYMNYILAYCKPCPKCKIPIEKNEGCMAMKCSVCGHHFCWVCLTSHSHPMACNKYNPTEKSKKENAKKLVEKYAHYFERWNANRTSKEKALEDLRTLKSKQFATIRQRTDLAESWFDNVTKGWMKVVECRGVLEWSYAYGYYLDDDEKNKRQLFEYLQGQAESKLEVLHHLLEKKLEEYLRADKELKDFQDYEFKVNHESTVTGSHFEKLIRALNNGLSEVREVRHSYGYGYEEEYWSCDRCTFANPIHSLVCQMCYEVFDLDD